MGRSSRILKMERLWEQVNTCEYCKHLQKHVTQKVFGDGNVSAKIALVGEGPGEEEDSCGHPFVGEAGKLLSDILDHAGLDREKIFICNAVKCRCWMKKGETVRNRKPKNSEIRACSSFLSKQLQIIQPRVVVGMGGTAIAALKKIPSAQAKPTRMAGLTERSRKCWYLWTYHPAYPIYRGRDLLVIEQMVRHMKKAKEIASGRR